MAQVGTEKNVNQTIRGIVFALMIEGMPGIMSWKETKHWLKRKSDKALYEFMHEFGLESQINKKNGHREFATLDVLTAYVEWKTGGGAKTIEDFIGNHEVKK